MGEMSAEYYSTTPEEIRELLGLDEDASQIEVVEQRLKDFDASLRESESRGEQPDSPALPDAGAPRGDTPLLETDKESK